MELSSELPPNSTISITAEDPNGAVLNEHPTPNLGSTAESVEKAGCLWCGRVFTPRKTGGSAQRFCSTEHRKAFWTAARRWTMRAIETGLLTIDCLKATQTSVHAAGEAFSR